MMDEGNQMSLKWKIITNLQRRFNRCHTTHAEMYWYYIVVPRLMKGYGEGVFVNMVNPATVLL